MAQLRAKWWDGIAPDGLKSNMSLRLKSYTRALKAGNIQEVYAASELLVHEVNQTRAKVKKLKALDKKTQKMLDDELLDVTDLLARDQRTLQKNNSTLVQIFDKDLSNEIAARLKTSLKLAVAPSISGIHIKMKVPLKVVQTLEYNNQETEVFRRAGVAIEKFIRDLEKDYEAQLKVNNGFMLSVDQTKKLEKLINSRISVLQDEIAALPRDVIRKGKDLAGIAKEYKTDRAVSITMASLGVAGSAAAMAAPGTQAVAIVGLIRSAASLVEEIMKVAMNVQVKAKALEANFKHLVDSYKKGGQAAKELAATTLNAILGANAIATISACKDRLDDLKKHLAYVMDRNNRLEGIIKELLDRLPKLKKSLEDCTANRAYAKKAKVWVHLKTLRKRFDMILDSVADTNSRITEAEFSLVRIRQATLKLTDNSAGVAALAKVIPIFVSLGLSFGSAADGIVASTQALNVVANSIGVAGDVLSEINDNIG